MANIARAAETADVRSGVNCRLYVSPATISSHPFFQGLSNRGESKYAKVCQVTGKGPATGTAIAFQYQDKRRFLPNLHWHRFWVESEKRFVRLRVSTKGMRIIDKQGIDAVLAGIRSRGKGVNNA